MIFKKTIVALLVTLVIPIASAEMYWNDTSWSLLKGSDYEVGDNEKLVYTLEHASGHSWGSTFLFFDRLNNQNDGIHETYGEILANFSWLKMDEGHFIKEVYLTPHLEFGPEDNFLFGIGASLDVPNAKYFDVTYFLRRNGGGKDGNGQLTLVWAFPFAGDFLYDGFLDAASSSDDAASSTNFTSQLKWDFGKNALDMKAGKLWLGVEYVYWNNKFGIEDSAAFTTNERNLNLLLKWHM